jgi:hypothetical protein
VLEIKGGLLGISVALVAAEEPTMDGRRPGFSAIFQIHARIVGRGVGQRLSYPLEKLFTICGIAEGLAAVVEWMEDKVEGSTAFWRRK